MNGRRVFGSVQCLGTCGRRVDVVFPYSNGDGAIGLEDHELSPGVRCSHAGLSVWTKDLGWNERRFRARYGPTDIEIEIAHPTTTGVLSNAK